MKRGLAIPCGLLLFALAVASFVTSRPTDTTIKPNKTAAAPVAVELAQTEDYVPPLMGIFDDQEVASPSPFTELAAVSFEEPRMLPLEILRQADWPAAQPDHLLRVGFDNPTIQPFFPTPKVPGGQSTTIIPDLIDTQSGMGSPNQPPAQNIGTRAPENLIRPKPLAMDNPGAVARFQATEPPLAGNPGIIAPMPAPAQAPPGMMPPPGPAPVQPVPVNLAEYTGCGCEPRIGATCGCGSRISQGCGCRFARQAPSCCQTFSSCCQRANRYYEVDECSNCCSGESRWRPFSKLRNWFRGEQRGCGSCGSFDDCGFESCGSSHRPLFSRFRGLFHRSRCDEGVCAESWSSECSGAPYIIQ